MDISVLISLSDRPELARDCLQSLERTVPRRWRYEVILAGEANAEHAHEDFRHDPRRRFVPHDGPPGRAASLNAAARMAKASVLCLLDPGTTLMPGWLEPMWQLLRREENAGCVGNVQREPYSGLIENAGVLFDADGLPVPAHHGEPLLPPRLFARRPAVSAACCLVRRAVFARLGGFDEHLRQRFHDVDFCLRAAEAGYRHFVAQRSVVYHLAASAPTLLAGPPDPDLTLFRARWGERARAHYRENAAQRDANTFTPARWLAAGESRRQHRQDLLDAREDGSRYLKKHLFKPWRYNYERVCRALVQSTHPLPAAIPHPPEYVADDDLPIAFDPAVNGRDAPLFAAPKR